MKTLATTFLTFLSLVSTAPPASAGEPPAVETPVSHLVDCDDSFWAVTCGSDPANIDWRRESVRNFNVECVLVPAFGEPTDWFYLPIRSECTECFDHLIINGNAVEFSGEICRPWPLP